SANLLSLFLLKTAVMHLFFLDIYLLLVNNYALKRGTLLLIHPVPDLTRYQSDRGIVFAVNYTFLPLETAGNTVIKLPPLRGECALFSLLINRSEEHTS